MITDVLKNYHFYFKEEGYYAERIPAQFGEVEKRSGKKNKDNDEENIEILLEKDRYKALYHLGFERCPDGVDIIGRYLFKLAGTFAEGLSRQPDIEISLMCSCPDWAILCKHVAAVLYGIGVRFDENPLLFFKLRGIDVDRFVTVALENKVESMLANTDCVSNRIFDDENDLSIFGL